MNSYFKTKIFRKNIFKINTSPVLYSKFSFLFLFLKLFPKVTQIWKFPTAIFYLLKKSVGQKKIKSFSYLCLISISVHFWILSVENNSKLEMRTSTSMRNFASRIYLLNFLYSMLFLLLCFFFSFSFFIYYEMLAQCFAFSDLEFFCKVLWVKYHCLSPDNLCLFFSFLLFRT